MKGDRVFVWVSHGKSSVYDASSIDALMNIVREFYQCYSGFFEDDHEKAFNRILEKYNTFEDPLKFEKEIINFITGHLDNDHWFEYGTGFTKVQ